MKKTVVHADEKPVYARSEAAEAVGPPEDKSGFCLAGTDNEAGEYGQGEDLDDPEVIRGKGESVARAGNDSDCGKQ